MGLQERKIREGAQPFLGGEEILAACIAAPRGRKGETVTGAEATAPAPTMGGKQRAGRGADRAQVRLAAPVGIVLTPTRLLTLAIGSPLGLGIGGKVREVLSAVAIEDVDSISVRQVGLRKDIVLTVRGAPIELQANATACTDRLVAELDRAKAARSPNPSERHRRSPAASWCSASRLRARPSPALRRQP